MRKSDFSDGTPHLDLILENCDDLLAEGGSCLSGSDGEWVIEPVVGEESLTIATINHAHVREVRFCPSAQGAI